MWASSWAGEPCSRRRSDGAAWRARRHRRRQRRRQVGAAADPRRGARAVGRGAQGGPVDPLRPARPGPPPRRPEGDAARARPARGAHLRGRGGVAPDEVPLRLRAGAPAPGDALGRRVDALAAVAPDAPGSELPAPRRADEPPRHRVGGDARVRTRGLRRHRRLRLARPLLPRPDRRPDPRGLAAAAFAPSRAAGRPGASARRCPSRPASARRPRPRQ